MEGFSLPGCLPAWLRVVICVIGGCALFAARADAYDADLAWRPVSGAAGYRVYVGYGPDVSGTGTNVGNPKAASDGAIHVQIGSLPVGPNGNFSVTAYATDGTESKPSNLMTLTYIDVASVIDSDGDGLRDAQEDVNLNGKVDPGETDPKKADTDGDGVSDGEEIAAGSDPLDPASKPTCGTACSGSIWLAAYRASSFYGAMRSGGWYANGNDDDPAADALLPEQVFAYTTANSWNGGSGDQVGYKIDVPVSGEWYAWGRFYYPAAGTSLSDANSFFVRLDSGTVRSFGNDTDKFRKWHWDGDGRKTTGRVVPLDLGYITAGTHTIWVEKREVTPAAPRLDVLMLTRDAAYVPSDADARTGLAVSSGAAPGAGDAPSGAGCTSDADCDDGIFCTVDRCDTASSTCANVPFDAFCDDGNACNGAETCNNDTGCTSGTPLQCDDGLVCNGQETCDPSEGCLPGEPLNCDDGVACTLDRCFEEAGGCRRFAFDQACDDGNPCTTDRCTVSGCTYAESTASCDDGLACTADDVCSGGVCSGHDACSFGAVCSAETDACQDVPGDPDNDGLHGVADPCPLDPRNLCAGPVAVDRAGTALRINSAVGDAACAGAKVDCNGDVWSADFAKSGSVDGVVCGGAGPTCAVSGVRAIFQCVDDATRDLFRCGEVSARKTGIVAYGFDVADGIYVVNMLFVSGDGQAKSERTDIVINDRTVASGFDVDAAAGAPDTAVIQSFVVEANAGLRIEIQPKGDRSGVLAGLEVLRLTK